MLFLFSKFFLQILRCCFFSISIMIPLWNFFIVVITVILVQHIVSQFSIFPLFFPPVSSYLFTGFMGETTGQPWFCLDIAHSTVGRDHQMNYFMIFRTRQYSSFHSWGCSKVCKSGLDPVSYVCQQCPYLAQLSYIYHTGILPLLDLHRKEFAPAACAAGLFLLVVT